MRASATCARLLLGHSVPAAVALVGVVALGAAAEPPAEPELAPFTLASIGIKGTLTNKLAVYPDTTPNDSRHVQDEVILEVEWARRLTPWAELKLVGEVRKDTDGFDEDVNWQIPETSLHRSIVDLKEAVARFSRGPYEVSVGKQIFAWGTAEAFNPTDKVRQLGVVYQRSRGQIK
jgi:hypothetical protein